MKKKAALFLTLCLLSGLFSAPLFADEMTDPTARPDYGTGAGRKLGRGIANTALGWVDIFGGIEEIGEKHNAIAGITWGPVYGLGKAITRTVAGVAEIVTFPIPAPNSNFEPLVTPEFPLQESESYS